MLTISQAAFLRGRTCCRYAVAFQIIIIYTFGYSSLFVKSARPLNHHVRHYATLDYDLTNMQRQHHIAKRSTQKLVKLDITAHGKKFKIRLRRDAQIFSPDLVVETSDGQIHNYDSSRAYVGNLEDDHEVRVHGTLSKEGHFEGKIMGRGEVYSIERALHHFPADADEDADENGGGGRAYHSVIYRQSDVDFDLQKSRCKSDDFHRRMFELQKTQPFIKNGSFYRKQTFPSTTESTLSEADIDKISELFLSVIDDDTSPFVSRSDSHHRRKDTYNDGGDEVEKFLNSMTASGDGDSTIGGDTIKDSNPTPEQNRDNNPSLEKNVNKIDKTHNISSVKEINEIEGASNVDTFPPNSESESGNGGDWQDDDPTISVDVGRADSEGYYKNDNRTWISKSPSKNGGDSDNKRSKISSSKSQDGRPNLVGTKFERTRKSDRILHELRSSSKGRLHRGRHRRLFHNHHQRRRTSPGGRYNNYFADLLLKKRGKFNLDSGYFLRNGGGGASGAPNVGLKKENSKIRNTADGDKSNGGRDRIWSPSDDLNIKIKNPNEKTKNSESGENEAKGKGKKKMSEKERLEEEKRKYFKRAKREIDPTKTTCLLYVQADHLFYKKFRSNVELVIEQLTQHVQGVNAIYRIIDFDQDDLPDTINFIIKRIKVHTNPDVPGYKFKGNYGVEKYLELFSEENYDDFCLAYMFTYRDFEGGTLGLAWTGDLQNAGGVCEKNGFFRGSMKSLNSGIVTILNYGKDVPSTVSHVTLAHEIGHNMGSQHDPETKNCAPGGDLGNYIMFARATSGDKPNNNKFSRCSKTSMAQVMATKARSQNGCFMVYTGSICGNEIKEDGEECDCGWEGDCKEDCCYPQKSNPAPSETPCTRKPWANCSPSEGPCCRKDCTLVDFWERKTCRAVTSCTDASYCDGYNAACPDSRHKPNKTKCEDDYVCYQGECTGSICLVYGLESCQCEPAIEGDWKDERLCHLCCKAPGERKPCKSSSRWRHPPYDVPNMMAKPGMPCNNYMGYCDLFHKCREVDPTGPLSTLRRYFFSEAGMEDMKKWVSRHWYIVAGVAAGITVFMVMFVKLCSKSPNRAAVRRQQQEFPDPFADEYYDTPPPPPPVAPQPAPYRNRKRCAKMARKHHHQQQLQQQQQQHRPHHDSGWV